MGNCLVSSIVDHPTPSTTGHISSSVAGTTDNISRTSGKTGVSSSSVGSINSASKDSFFSSTWSGGDDAEVPSGQILPASNLRVFSFPELKAATKNFRIDTLLGEGGFGKVYKGWLDEKGASKSASGSNVVAVKKLKAESMQGYEEWQSEVHFLGRLSHPNLVKLLGYCWEDDELLLVYEYMQRGSLENHLFGRGSTVHSLPWNIRLKLAIGAAQGLFFLHTSEHKVIYRDFKASNILLDGDYNAKISDFGLAKLAPTSSHSHLTTRVIGTHGYAAPEYVATGHLYVKSDVYGFGVVLVEILTGLRALDVNRPSGQHRLVDWVKPYLSDRRKLKAIMDARLEGKYHSRAAIRMAHLALRCLEKEPKMRPSMKDVLETLKELEGARDRVKEPRIKLTTSSSPIRPGLLPSHLVSPYHQKQNDCPTPQWPHKS